MLLFAIHIHLEYFIILYWYFILRFLKSFRAKFYSKKQKIIQIQNRTINNWHLHICIQSNCKVCANTPSVCGKVFPGNKTHITAAFTLTVWCETPPRFWGTFLDCSHRLVWFTEQSWVCKLDFFLRKMNWKLWSTSAPTPNRAGSSRVQTNNGCSTQLWIRAQYGHSVQGLQVWSKITPLNHSALKMQDSQNQLLSSTDLLLQH